MPFQEIQALGKLLHELIFLHQKGEIYSDLSLCW